MEGTIEVKFDKWSKTYNWIITGARPVLMINRIIPYTDVSGPNKAKVPINFTNIEHIEWLMQRYPLQDKTNGKWDKALDAVIESREKAKQLTTLEPVSPPASFKGELMDFQKQGLDFLQKCSGVALLADEMGLGKGVTALSFLASSKQAFPAVIIAPLVTLHHWKHEIQKFLRITDSDGKILVGIEDSPTITLIRTGKPEPLEPFDIYIINYDLITRRSDDLRQINPRTLIFDEVQALRSFRTKRYHSTKELCNHASVKYKLGLSGTPIYNHGSEIWAIIDILKPGLLGTFHEFAEYYCYDDFRGRKIVLEERRDVLREELSRYIMLRRRKKDVINLPEKIRHKQIIPTDENYYKRELTKLLKKLDEQQSEAKTSFERTAIYERTIQSERKVAGMAKLWYVIDFVKNIMELEESVVVFCHHTIMHELLYNNLKSYSPCKIIGQQTDTLRQIEIDRFQSGQSKLMIAGIRAGNVGINLTKANYVIFAELDWSPAYHRQAEDRLHRIGQEKRVFSYYLIGEGTLDETVANVLVDKSLEIDTIMDAGSSIEDQSKKAEEIIKSIREQVALKIRNKQ